jgi:hypothetical protein
MVESFERERTPAVSDDLIRDALRTGLSSIHASDDLIKETLAACQKELKQVEIKDKKSPHKPIWSWMLKLGTPLAAGALVCVLVFSRPMMKSSTGNAAAPVPSAAGSSEVMSDEDQLAIAFSEPQDSAYKAAEDPTSASISGLGSDRKGLQSEQTYTHRIEVLFSAANRTEMEYSPDNAGYMEYFEAIVTQYNTVQGTQLSLNKTGVTRVETLVETGVTADMLRNMTNYHELLSGKGYWLLPLHNADGLIEGLVTVNAMEAQNKDLIVADNDFVFSTNHHRFLVSPHPNGNLVAKNCEKMFDTTSLINEIKVSGIKNVTDLTVVDINFGMDFLVMFEGDGKQMAIPFVLEQEAYGLENQRIYPSVELIEIITEKMLE